MLEAWGDIWKYLGHKKIVIPTNIGWTKDGRNVMGRGLAAQAADYYPSVVEWYGGKCKEFGADTPVMEWGPLILFPVKELDVERPYMSWKKSASLPLIEKSAQQLAWWKTSVALPMIGCGNGRLKPVDVIPVLQKYLGDNFTLVRV